MNQTTITNMTPYYLQSMKNMFRDYNISNEDQFCESLFDIVNLYTESVFAGNPNTIKSFLFFQDLEFITNTAFNRLGNNQMTPLSLVYEGLIILLQTYTYEMYLNDMNNN